MTILGKAVGVTTDGLFHFAEPCVTRRGTRRRADRIRDLDLVDLVNFRLAATTSEGKTFWWTAQAPGSPHRGNPGKLVFSFASLTLVDKLKITEWRLVDDGGYLVRLRRVLQVFPAEWRLNASYVLAFDGSDKRI